MSDPVVAPRPAATILLLREGREGLETFMMVRHYQIDFASGALVFPGGSVDPDDHAIVGKPALYHAAGMTDPTALSFRIAALRETFEESGILLARERGSEALVSAAQASAIEAEHRGSLCEGKAVFSDILAGANLVLALDLLVPFAHWITPAGLPKRFDTHFFAALAPADQIGAHDGKESTDSIWISPQEALAGAKTGRFKMLFPTVRNLIRLGKQTVATAALEVARQTPVVTVLPVMTSQDGRRQLRIPIEAGYDGDVFDAERG